MPIPLESLGPNVTIASTHRLHYLLLTAVAESAQRPSSTDCGVAGGTGAGRVEEEDYNDDTTPTTMVVMVAGSNREAMKNAIIRAIRETACCWTERDAAI